MKWPTKKLKYLDVPIYDIRVWLIDSRDVWDECMSFLDYEHRSTNCDGLFYRFENNKTDVTVFMIGFFDGKVSTLLHEIAHCTFSILDYVGIDVKEGSNEAYCYLLQYLFDGAKGKLKI